MAERHASPVKRLALALAADADLVEEMPIEDVQRELGALKVGSDTVLVLLLKIYTLIEEARLAEAGYPDGHTCVFKALLEPERLRVLLDEREDLAMVESRLKSLLDMSEIMARSSCPAGHHDVEAVAEDVADVPTPPNGPRSRTRPGRRRR